jgi:hypothetical protein
VETSGVAVDTFVAINEIAILALGQSASSTIVFEPRLEFRDVRDESTGSPSDARLLLDC